MSWTLGASVLSLFPVLLLVGLNWLKNVPLLDVGAVVVRGGVFFAALALMGSVLVDYSCEPKGRYLSWWAEIVLLGLLPGLALVFATMLFTFQQTGNGEVLDVQRVTSVTLALLSISAGMCLVTKYLDYLRAMEGAPL